MPKIYDACMFHNELDMLELRFNILNDVVDYFVVCEAEETHSGKPKPLNLLAHWDRFKPFHKKMVYVNAGPLSNGVRTSWDRERYHRSKIADGLSGAMPNDWILVCDCDEIPNPDLIEELKSSNLQAFKLELAMYYYNFNHRVDQGWAIGFYRKWIEADPNKIRTCAGYNPTPVLNAGWHFSYMGGAEQILNKVDSFMHHADPGIRDMPRDPAYIESKIAASLDLFGRDLKITHLPGALPDTMPQYVLNNLDKYRALGWLE